MRQKKKENRVMCFLREANITVDREVPISYSCMDATSRKSSRLDGVIDLPDRNLRIILEVDEFQHADRETSCEVARMNDSTACIRIGGETRKLLWIRFNPDEYKVDGVSTRTRTVDRHAALESLIRSYKPVKDTAVVYMYYTLECGEPAVFSDADYPASFKSEWVI